MSTRATYQINNQTLYIHYDGYSEGAASYFYAMYNRGFGNNSLLENFIRANERSHFVPSKDSVGDTEYHYEVSMSEDRAMLNQFHRGVGQDEWKNIYSGELMYFINLNKCFEDGESGLTHMHNFGPVTLGHFIAVAKTALEYVANYTHFIGNCHRYLKEFEKSIVGYIAAIDIFGEIYPAKSETMYTGEKLKFLRHCLAVNTELEVAFYSNLKCGENDDNSLAELKKSAQEFFRLFKEGIES